MSGFTYKSPGSVGINSPLSSFNELTVNELVPSAQGDFVYNINAKVFETLTLGGGTVSHAAGVCTVNSSNNLSGSATVRLRRANKYQAGQGSLFRGTAVFGTPIVGNRQLIGLGNRECGYYFGYLNEDFGILHIPTSQVEIRALTVATPAGTENVTVTLNGQSIVVPVIGGLDASQTAYQLSKANYSSVGVGWSADAIGNVVYFLARQPGPRTGTYTAVGGTVGSLGSFARTAAGIDETLNFVSQSAWNIDPLDGSGTSRMTLDPTKGNIYQVGFQYLGFGNAFFSIENPETGRVIPVHMIKNANARTTPVLKNPNVSGRVSSTNLPGNAGLSVSTKSVSMATFNEGIARKLDPKFSYSARVSFPDTSNVFKPFLALKVNRVFNNTTCFGEIDFLRMSLTNESGASPKSYTVGIFGDSTIVGDVNFQNVDATNSIVSYAVLDPSAQTITPATPPLFAQSIADGNVSVDLAQFDFAFGEGRVIVLAVSSDDSVTGNFSISWYEQQ